MRIFNLPAIFTLIILLGLSACGGGGGGGGSQTNATVTYTVASSAGAGGSISSTQTVDEGGAASFTVTPDTGFIINSVSGCSGSLTGNTYTTGAITADCSVTATFTERALNAVSALFPTNGANWNDYVAGSDPTTATDTACDMGTITDCLHGGELRAVEVTDKSSCTDLTATDTLGAFNWECDDSTNPVRMISTGLADKKYLSDLIDFTGNTIKPDGVTVFDNGVQYGATPETVWWSNAIAVNNSSGSGSVIHLTTESTIYLVTNNVSAAYSIDADRIGVVIEPGITVTGELSGGLAIGSSDVLVSGATRLWIEGQVDASTYNRGIRLLNSHFTRLRNVKVSHAASEGIYVGSGQLMYLRYITTTDNDYGIRLSGVNSVSTVKNATLEDALVSGNTQCGLYVTGNRNVVSRLDAIDNGNSSESANVCLEGQNADLNQFFDINASHGVYYGIWLINAGSGDVSENAFNNIRVSNNGVEGIVLGTGSFSNTFTQATVSNNRNTGILIVSTGPANNNRFADVTIANNGAGGISAGEYDFLMNVVASNNGANGIIIGANDTAFNLAAINNATDGIYLNSADDSVFTGLLKVGSNGADCTVNGGTNPGLTGACANVGTSDATASFSVDASTSFVGKVTSGDTQNTSDTNGGATDAVGSAADFDWIHFENDFRAWGIDGSAFANADHRGQWPDGSDGRIWDWSVSASDVGDGGNPALFNVLALPDGNDTFDLVDFVSTQTGLRNAIEFLGDDIGDDDGICESGETCLYTPNIGAYQGHGNLISAGAFTDGTLTGVTLLRYENNGR